MTAAQIQEEFFGKFNREGSLLSEIRGDRRYVQGFVQEWEVLAAYGEPDAPRLVLVARLANWVGSFTGTYYFDLVHWAKTPDRLDIERDDGRRYSVDFLDENERASWLEQTAYWRAPENRAALEEARLNQMESLESWVAASIAGTDE